VVVGDLGSAECRGVERYLVEHDLAGVSAHAVRLGLSRTAYLRRQLAQDAARAVRPVTVKDLEQFAVTFADLGDEEVMARAWR